MDFDLIDEMVQVNDRDAFASARALVRTEGILAGVSSGAVVWGIADLLKRIDRPACIVTIFPDGASHYLTKMFNEEWLAEHGLV
jgi:cystathionine beta-synthase